MARSVLDIFQYLGMAITTHLGKGKARSGNLERIA